LKKKEGNEEMKEWVTLADESKTVENLSTIEFDLANAELHDEFRLYVEVGKNANSDGEVHNLLIIINGMSVGYYIFNTKWDANYNKYFEFEKLPKPRILTSVTSSVNVKFNTNNALFMYDNLGAETGDGKILFKFPTNYKYTGTIKVQLYAR
jgi:hypothetical protein